MKAVKLLKVIALNAIVTLVLLEMGLILAAMNNLLRMDLPSYSIANVSPFWRDTDPAFGVWHAAEPAVSARKIVLRRDLQYERSARMRDPERNLRASSQQVVVLGDSFIEGYGVASESRLTNLLEGRTGFTHLNFGTSGNFGLTQSWLLYKTLASSSTMRLSS